MNILSIKVRDWMQKQLVMASSLFLGNLFLPSDQVVKEARQSLKDVVIIA